MTVIEYVRNENPQSSIETAKGLVPPQAVAYFESARDPAKAIASIRSGVDPLIVRALGDMGVEPKYQAQIIPARTLQRRIAQGELLTPGEGERAMRFARIIAEADRVFGDHEKGMRWLKSPKRQLEGQSPLDLMDTDLGVQLVQNMLGQIDEGYFA